MSSHNAEQRRFARAVTTSNNEPLAGPATVDISGTFQSTELTTINSIITPKVSGNIYIQFVVDGSWDSSGATTVTGYNYCSGKTL